MPNNLSERCLLNKLDNYYVAILYVTLGFLWLGNATLIFAGHWLSLFPILVQSLVIALVYFRTPSAYIAVRLWAGIAIIIGIALWSAILLRGGLIVESAGLVIETTFLIPICIFLFLGARRVLDPEY